MLVNWSEAFQSITQFAGPPSDRFCAAMSWSHHAHWCISAMISLHHLFFRQICRCFWTVAPYQLAWPQYGLTTSWTYLKQSVSHVTLLPLSFGRTIFMWWIGENEGKMEWIEMNVIVWRCLKPLINETAASWESNQPNISSDWVVCLWRTCRPYLSASAKKTSRRENTLGIDGKGRGCEDIHWVVRLRHNINIPHYGHQSILINNSPCLYNIK